MAITRTPVTKNTLPRGSRPGIVKPHAGDIGTIA